MAHYIAKANLNAANYVMPTSRYINSQLIHYTENKNLTFETYKAKNKSFYRKSTGQYMEITPNVEFRPDLLSYELFGTPDLWWRIMEENNMKDILEFKVGRNIKVPGNILA